MTSGQDPIERLRRTARKPVPTAAEKALALGRLQHAIATEQELARKPGFRPGWRPLAAFAAAAAIILATVPFLVTNPAQAALTEIAQAARETNLLEVPEGSFVYSRSEHKDLAIRPGEDFGMTQDFVGYILPTTRQVWRNPTEQFILIHTTVGTPEFFDPQTEAAYYAARLDQADQVGETIVEQFTEAADPVIEAEWPTQPEQLAQAMKTFIVGTRNQPADTTQIFDLAADILRETHPSPQLRGAVLQVLAQQPVALDEQTPTTLTVSHAEEDRQVAITLTRDGHLLAETTILLQADPQLGLTEGTVIASAGHQPTRVVAELP